MAVEDEDDPVVVGAAWVVDAVTIAGGLTAAWLTILAVAQYIDDERWLLAAVAFVLWPLSVVVYPFLAPADHIADPFRDGTSLVPFGLFCLAVYLLAVGKRFLLED